MAETVSLVGLYFQTFMGERVQYQGLIIGHPHPDYVLAEHLDEGSERTGIIELIPLSAMARGATQGSRHSDGAWQFYRAVEEMRARDASHVE